VVTRKSIDPSRRGFYSYHRTSGASLTLSRSVFLPISAAALLSLAGCKTIAIGAAADAVAGTGDVFASDDDPELVRDAIPFALKTMEALLAEKPGDEGLLTALASGFTQYAFAFVQADADAADLAGQVAAARAGRDRAKHLYLRARTYGLRALRERHEKLDEKLLAGRDPQKILLQLEDDEDVPLLYWTASAWTLAIANGKDDMSLVSELPIPIAMMERALALDERWGEGALHEFFVTYDATRSAAQGGGPDRVRKHLERALALSMNKKLGPHVSYAEGVLVQAQDRAEFTRVLEKVLAADAGEVPKYRLANVLAQRRAKLLLAHADDLFL
jgi:predicted anti-sigma-YlaC factor YlaD